MASNTTHDEAVLQRAHGLMVRHEKRLRDVIAGIKAIDAHDQVVSLAMRSAAEVLAYREDETYALFRGISPGSSHEAE